MTIPYLPLTMTITNNIKVFFTGGLVIPKRNGVAKNKLIFKL
jgi:hypothetical protein